MRLLEFSKLMKYYFGDDYQLGNPANYTHYFQDIQFIDAKGERVLPDYGGECVDCYLSQSPVLDYVITTISVVVFDNECWFMNVGFGDIVRTVGINCTVQYMEQFCNLINIKLEQIHINIDSLCQENT